MDINHGNKRAIDFYQSIYEQGVDLIGPYAQNLGAQKFLYFRLYDGGCYYIFSNTNVYVEQINYAHHENSPSFMQFIRQVPLDGFQLFSSPASPKDPMQKLLWDLKWRNYNILYCRHENYVDCVSLAPDQDDDLFNHFCVNNTLLVKNFYWLARKKFDKLVPFNEPHAFSQFRNGADIAYQPPDAAFRSQPLEQSVQALLEDMSRKKLSLTPREWEACKGLARGETAKETARVLGIQHRTVEIYLKRMYCKFETQLGYKPSRAQVMKMLYATLDTEFLTRALWVPSYLT